MYYKADIDAPVVAITQDGITGLRYNGVPDWVYEGEIHQWLQRHATVDMGWVRGNHPFVTLFMKENEGRKLSIH